MTPQKDNKSYYDEFSKGYEKERHEGYHALIDSLETELVLRYANQEAKVLEAGCGTGLILRSFSSSVKQAVGFDLSKGMLSYAKQKKLEVCQATITALPFASETFDVVCSFKVLAHVKPIEQALQEMTRVLKPGGYLIAEFYNPSSLRGLIKRWKKPTAISEQTTDEAVFTRYDSLSTIKSYLPKQMKMEAIRGVRIFTPFSQIHKWPILGPLFGFLERKGADAPLLRRLGGFLIVVAQKENLKRLEAPSM